jgi:hypothetical protein
MSQADDQPETSGQAGSQDRSDQKSKSRRFGQTLLGLMIVGMSLLWLVMFAIGLTHMPDAQAVAEAPEIVVTARYLSSGKNRLELEKPDADLRRYSCDPPSRLCRFVVQHSPVELTARLAGPDDAMSADEAVLFARAGDEVLVAPAEGNANLASLKSTYRDGLNASVVGLVLGGLFVRRTRS